MVSEDDDLRTDDRETFKGVAEAEDHMLDGEVGQGTLLAES